MKQNDFLDHIWILPLGLRSELKNPLGSIIRPNTPEYRETLAHPPSKFICVGDIVTETFVNAGKSPWIIITDGVTKREKIGLKTFESYKILQVVNPAGKITPDAWRAIRQSVIGEERTHILVKGEEDLLTIPVIIEAPVSTVIFYGQPNVGMVRVEVTDSVKKTLMDLLSRFEKQRK